MLIVLILILNPGHSELDSESHERIEFLELFYEALNFDSLFQDKE